ncbi:MAG: hypothetical protein ACR2O6_03800 [Ilumatobacteraceae bacterium]
MTGRRIALVGEGVVGGRIARRLPLAAPDVTVLTVDPRRSLAAFERADLAILACPSPHDRLAAELIARGIAVVSVGDDLDDVRALLDLEDQALHAGVTLVVGAGMSPGLSGLLARHLGDQLTTVDEIHVAIHGTAGPACARQHHRALRGRAIGLHNAAWVTRSAGAGRELCWFPEPVGAYDCYAAEMAGPLLLQRSFADVSRLTARMSANRRDRLTARLPMLSPPHPEVGVGAVRVEVRGARADGARSTLITGVAELVGTITAATASAVAVSVLEGAFEAGTVATSDAGIDAVGLLTVIERLGVRLQEFTGVPT